VLRSGMVRAEEINLYLDQSAPPPAICRGQQLLYGTSDYHALLDEIDQDDALLQALDLQSQARKGETARATLLRLTVAIDTSIKQHCFALMRPYQQDIFANSWSISMDWFWRVHYEQFFRTPHAALIHNKSWALWRCGYRTRVVKMSK
jgi:hypothetical protein